MLKKSQFVFFAISLFLIFVCLNISVSLLGRKLNIDVSANKKYSLSQQTKNWLEGNQKDIFVRLYVSANWKNNYLMKEYSADVLRLLEEYQMASNNKISIKVIEVKPLSVAAAEAKKFGLKGEKEELWLGVIVSDEAGNLQTIPYLNPLRVNFLEYDITKLLSQLAKVEKPKIGVMSSELNVKAKKVTFGDDNSWAIIKALENEYDFVFVDPKIGFVSDDIDVLMLVNPKDVSKLTHYAIDQYLMRGGNLLIFLDPLSEVALAKGTFVYGKSGLEELLSKMGVKYNYQFLSADLTNARLINTNANNYEKYPLWINSYPKNEHQLLNNLDKVMLNTSGFLEIEPKDKISSKVLLTTSQNSGIGLTSDALISSANVVINKSLDQLDQELVLAVLLEGNFVSAYMEPYLNTQRFVSGNYAFRSISLSPSKVIVVTDSDLLNVKLWNGTSVNKQETITSILHNGNFEFVDRALRYLSGNKIILPSVKQNKVEVLPLNAALKLMAEKIYEKKRQKINNDLADLEIQQNEINDMIKEQGNIPSVQIVRKMENIQRQQSELRAKQEKYKYQILILHKVLFGIWLTLNFLLPIVFIAIIVGIMKWYSQKWYKLAEKIADES